MDYDLAVERNIDHINYQPHFISSTVNLFAEDFRFQQNR